MYSKAAALIGFFAATSTGVVAQSASVPPTSSSVAMMTGAPVGPAGNGTGMARFAYFNTTMTTTLVVDALTTLCAEVTTLTFNDCEYPATAGEIVTVTNCPCTITTAQQILTSSLCETPTPLPVPTGNNNNIPAPVAPTAIATAPTPVTTGGSAPVYTMPSGPSAVPPAVQVAGASSGGPAAAGFVGVVAVLVGGFVGV
ncbi:hypothetical protein F4775DRAFT_595699 [Biscogniauxia sp. FL1348]|nr:hypothetical protein F4775DRAFT_595699 [Biscogniauxia sp. FL1348]